jgi:hypothetical protein
MDQAIRNRLRGVVTQCRKLLEEAVSQELQGRYDIYAGGKRNEVQIDDESRMTSLSEEDLAYRRDLLDHLGHVQARGLKPRDALEQLIREIAFTHLNRLCAYKMMEARQVHIGGHRFREAVSRGFNSNGVKFYLADHPEDERLFNTGHQDIAYRHFLDWLGGLLSEEIGVLFDPDDPVNRLYPPQRVLDQVLELINHEELGDIWSQDETIGWIYQYFTPKELRERARKESAAPRNSYELAFRNQFYTPRYVVQFLTDNTLGRIWYEMRQGETRLVEQCEYLVRRPDEVFLGINEESPVAADDQADAGFLLGKTDEMAEFAMPGDGDDEAASRLAEFAQMVRPFDMEGDPSPETSQSLLAEVANGAADEPVEGKTQDLWDCILAAHSGGRFAQDVAEGNPVAVTRMANGICRRLLVGRKEDGSSEELLNAPYLVPFREKKDPREIKILDPACGSGHFLLYCFDLLLTIYEEAWDDEEAGERARTQRVSLRDQYGSKEEFLRDVPGLILEHNLHGIDIDVRATQIAALALWLRAQMLQDGEGLPPTETPEGYPIEIDWDGILVDDLDHTDDLIARARAVLTVIWEDRAEAIEQEACEILDVKSFRDYFRNTGKGGFWDDHVKRYSKSRRTAPIYWYLRSSKGNYGLWLYYHRLVRDILYKALVNHVEPKLRLEESNLTQLRSQREAAGTSGRDAKRLERELEKQDALVSEVQDFHDKLRRAAELNLEPDLNDGVVLSIAPLWELVPWKEAKRYWDELTDGKYEWSSIGKQLRDRGLVADEGS